MLIISSYTATTGKCFAKNEYFANIFKESERSITRKIAKLAEAGYIEVDYERRGTQVIKRNIRLTRQLPDRRQNCLPTVDKNGEYINSNTYNKESNISISKPITNTPTNITKEKKKSKNITIEQGLEIAEEIFKKEEVADLDGFMVLAKVWLTYREELKKPYVPIGFKMAVKRLLKLSYNNFDKASEIIEFSIANNYQGLFSAK